MDALVSGQPIDWEGVDPNDQQLAPLRQLQHIQLAMKEQLHSHIEDVPDDYEFQWGHLYAIESIGRGGFGEVFRCHDAALCRPVALKLLNEEHIRSWQKNQFIEEARNMARVRSPHVLTIHGAAMHQGQVGFWCDFIQGQTLEQVDVTADWDEAQRLMQALALAVQAVHDSQLVHGDIKPANVMLSDQGRYVLMDFGGSLLGDEADWAAANWVGSPEYMAPELFGEQSKTPASDIYALGLLCIRQLSGASPFVANNWEQLAQQKQAPLRWPSSAQHVPKPWQRLLLSLCHPEPEQRPSAQQVVESMAELQARPERLRKRNLRWAVMGLLLVGLLISGWASWRIQAANTQLAAEKITTEQVNRYLSDLLNAGSSMGRGRDVRMVDVIDAAAGQIEASLADNPSTQAQLHQAVGNSYNSLRLPAKALPHLQQSLTLFRETAGAQSIQAMNAQLELAFAQLLLGEVEASEALVDEVIKWSTAGPEAVHVLALVRKARIHIRRGENQAVLALLSPWTHLAEPPIETQNNLPTMVLTTLSDAHYNLSQFDQALALAQQAEAILPAWTQILPTRVMAIHTQIAKAAERVGDIELALRHFSQLVDDALLFYGQGNLAHINTLVNYGAILQRNEQHDASFAVKQQAYELAEKKLGLQHRTTLQAGMNYANALTQQEMFRESQALMESLLPFSAVSFGESHMFHFMLKYNLVELLNKQEKFTEAWPITQHNEQAARQDLGMKHHVTWFILHNRATTAAGLGFHDEAWALLDEIDALNGTEKPILADLHELAEGLKAQLKPR